MAAQQVDGFGPVWGYAGRVQVDAEGVQIPGLRLAEDVDPQARWQPVWIAPQDTAPKQVGTVRFRRELELSARPESAVTLVTADPHYQLWINGVLASRGPDDAGVDFRPHERWSHRWLANRIEVAPLLHVGRNVIAAELYPGARGAFSLKAGVFALQMRWQMQGRTEVMSTGGDWVAQYAGAYTRGAGGNVYDARADDAGWREVRASAAGWAAAKQVESVWGPVAISALPPMMEAVWPMKRVTDLAGKAVGFPAAVAAGGGLRVEYDRVLSGYIGLELQGAPGTLVTIGPSETKSGKPRRPFQVILGEGVTRFESPGMESFSLVQVESPGAEQPVTVREVRATFVSQPVAYRGSFSTSDEHLNALWKAARWQTQLCMQNRWLDSPDHQEPIGDAGDYLIESQVSDYAFGPVAETPQFLRQFAGVLDNWMAGHAEGAVNFHTSYSLLWLQTLLDDYDATGDPTVAKELAPSAYRLLARYAQWVGKNGLVSEAPNYLFMDWVKIGGFNAHHPPAVIGQGYLSALYYRGLQDGVRLAEMTGDAERARLYRAQMSALRAAFQRELWDADAGLYRDGVAFANHQPTKDLNMLPPDVQVETHSPQVNALAVLYDLAPVEEQRAIMTRALKTGGEATGGDAKSPLASLNAQPYFMHFIFAAEAHAGVFGEFAAAQMAWWKLNPETGTFQEMWSSGDWSHGWGGTPLVQMSGHVLGVSAGAPGFAKVLLAPNPLGLKFAKGSVPTRYGDVEVEWKLTGAEFRERVKLPAEIIGVVDLSGVTGSLGAMVSVDREEAKPYSHPVQISSGIHSVVMNLKVEPH